jgi:hypothetical protein
MVRSFSLAPVLISVLSAAALPALCEPITEVPVLRAETPLLAPITLSEAQAGQDNRDELSPSTVSSAKQEVSAKGKNEGDPEAVCLAIHPPVSHQSGGRSDALTTTEMAASTDPKSDEAISQNDNGQPVNVPGNLPSAPAPAPIPYWETSTPFAPEGELRRALPAPLDPVFPGTEWVGQPLIGVPDTNPVFPLEKAIYKACPALKKARIQIYGWSNPGMGYSSSTHSNIPLTYAIVPRRLEMEQQVLRIERTPDTVQTKHMDWGFRISNIYGIDYRWTTAAGWFPANRSLLSHNLLYGYDYPELYGQIYYPHVAQGMMIKFGRYISPPDIEAQLAPDNYLWTHSVMFTFDAYTHTGIQSTIKLSDHWMIQGGIHSVSDMAPWAHGAQPTLECYLRWTSKTNNDSIFGGIDGINNGKFRLAKDVVRAEQLSALTGQPLQQVPAHDNLQQFNITWGHRFNRRVHMMTEGYFLYSIDALQGGTPNYGPPHSFNALTGPGQFLPGFSYAMGFVNYTQFKCTDRDYISIRPIDYLIDPRGWRTGFPTSYASWTIGWVHRFSDLLTIRPEIRYERALNYNGGKIVTPYDNGTRRFQFTFGLDVIQRF